VGDKVGQITCLRNLGILALMKGQPSVSKEFHDRALDLAQKTGLRTIEAECQFYVAELARLQQRFAQARVGYQRVLDLLPEGVTPEVRGNALAALAECLIRMPRFDSKEFERRLALLRPADSYSPYVHRAKAWYAFLSGHQAAALAELGQAMDDPRRQAPELRAELEQTRTRFQAATGS
jgi:tetratricopeptide (TPR) repeat protein